MRLIAIPPYRNPAVEWGWVLRHLVDDYRRTGSLEGVEVEVDDGYLVESTSEKRDEEVLACVVLNDKIAGDAATATSIQDWCLQRLAYFKAPGHVAFIDELPVTSTNKVQKARLADFALDPARRFDLRARKRRPA